MQSPVEVVQTAIDAFLAGDLETIRTVVDSDLEWTFLDPSEPDPTPQTCRGRFELEQAMSKWQQMGLTTTIDQCTPIGGRVLVILHATGLDSFRARAAEDRNFHVVTVENGRVTAVRACRNAAETRSIALAATPTD